MSCPPRRSRRGRPRDHAGGDAMATGEEITSMSKETTMDEARSGTSEGRSTTGARGLPLEMRLLSAVHQVVHRVSGGRLGTLNRGKQTPTGRTLGLITAVHRRLYRWTGGAVG